VRCAAAVPALSRTITSSLPTCWPVREGLANVNAIDIVRMIKTIGAITVMIPRNFIATLFIGGANARLLGFTIPWSLCPPCGFCYFSPNICSSLPAPLFTGMPANVCRPRLPQVRFVPIADSCTATNRVHGREIYSITSSARATAADGARAASAEPRPTIIRL
jgi:hypothetical protein